MNFKIFASKNGGQFESDLYGQFNRYMHLTPFWFALNNFILELNDSAFALVFLLIKKFKIVSK